jgi:hypothetical protein
VQEYADPDHPDESLVAGAAVDALKALLLHNARLQRDLDHRDAELLDTQRLLERSVLRPTYRWRQRTVRRLESSRSGRYAMKLYRRARGRSSRSA